MAIMAGALIDAADFSDTGWLDDGITWGTNWEDYQPVAAGSNHFEYRRVGSLVYLRGLARRINSALSTTDTVLTLPAGFIPSRSVITACMTNGSWVTGAASAGTAHTHNVISSSVSGPMLRVTVTNTSGVVQVVVPAQVTIAIDNWLTFAGVSYLVDL